VRVQSLAKHAGDNESGWLRQAVLAAARQSDIGETGSDIAVECIRPRARLRRVGLRLAADDRQILMDRAEARGMRPATYAAVLMRAHLRGLTPLPATELRVFRTAVLELSAMGRNLDVLLQHMGTEPVSTLPGRQDVIHMLKICTVLRDHLHTILKTNLESWKVGHGKN
jgi:hypothetical protein